MENVDIPIVMYNNPARAGIDFPLDIMDRLVTEFENVVGLKQTVNNALVDSIGLLGDRIQVIPKAEKELLMALALGGSGAMTFLANIAPEQTVEMYNLFTGGKVDEARKLYLKYLPLMNALHFEPIPAALIYVLNRLGWDFGNPRLPIHPIFPENAKKIDSILEKLDLV
jgi:4-hydroxy-tetrahydrodipicolinate synthase